MTKLEVEKFMRRIKSYYDWFMWDEFKLSEWYSKLKDYDSLDVNAKLEEHLRGEMKDKPPMLQYIIRYLKTPEEKKLSSKEYIVDCNLCGRTMTLSEYNAHYGICLEIKALQKWIKEKKGQEPTYEVLASLNRETFEKVYKKYEKKEGIDEFRQSKDYI